MIMALPGYKRHRPKAWDKLPAALQPVPPPEHPQRAQRVPPARRSRRPLEIEINPPRMDAVEQPPAVRLPLGPNDRHRLRHPGLGIRTRTPEVVQRPQHVVVPVVRERELQVRRPDDIPRAPAAEQPAFEQVLLTTPPGRAHRIRSAGRP